jgi:hypothetical protein
MERPTFFYDPAKWIVPVALLTIIGWLVVEKERKSRHSQLLAAHQQALKQHEKDWARREIDYQLGARDVAVARERRHREEWLRAMGGPLGVALKDPGLTLTGMIEELARACAPGSRAHARAERFSEFNVFIELPVATERAALAEIARSLLAYTSEYVHRVQFSHAGALVGELDRRSIESISDWSNAPIARIEKLISDPEHSEPPTFVGAVGSQPQTTSVEPQNLPEEFREQNRAEQQFQARCKQANQQLVSAMEFQSDAVNLAGAKSARDFDDRRATLARAEKIAAEAKAVLADPVAEYERVLRERKLDSVYVRAATRTAAQTYGRSPEAILKVFDLLARRSRSAAEFLDVMKNNFSLWTYSAIEQRYEFQDNRAQEDYLRAIRKFDNDSRAIQAAIEAWSAPSGKQ